MKKIAKDDAGRAVTGKLEELKSALESVKNPEDWAETYFRSAAGFVDNVDAVIRVLKRMK
jgi:hypothetical protein